MITSNLIEKTMDDASKLFQTMAIGPDHNTMPLVAAMTEIYNVSNLMTRQWALSPFFLAIQNGSLPLYKKRPAAVALGLQVRADCFFPHGLATLLANWPVM